MYRVLNKTNGKIYADCVTKEEAKDIQEISKNSIIVDLEISKEQRKKTVQRWYALVGLGFNDMKDGTITKEEWKVIAGIWNRLDSEYSAMYNEDY